MLLRITNGTTTLTLHSDSGTPATGLYGARYIPTEGDGAMVTETIDVVFGGTPANILASMSTVKRLLSEAAATDVYLEYTLIDGGTVYRSPIISGSVVWSDDRLKRQFHATTTAGECAVILTRKDYWEGDEETLGDGLIVNGTSSPYNAITLSNFAVSGSNLPVPVTVTMQNESDADLVAPTIYLNMDSFGGVTTNQHLCATGAGAVSWSANLVYGLNPLWYITVPDALIAKYAGKDVHVLATFTSFSTPLYLRAGLSSLYDSIYQRIQIGSEAYTINRELINLGTLQFPKSATAGLRVSISGYSVPSGSATLAFVQLMPAAGAVRLDVSHEWQQDDYIIYDENGSVYDNGTTQYSNVRKSGGPLMAWPGRTNRLSVLFEESGGNYNATRQTNVTVTARPRRSTV
jgi:hypothetical protein